MPTDAAEQRNFKIVFESLPNYQGTPAGLTVALTVEPSGGGPFMHISANLSYDQQYRSAALNLPKGSYKIKGLIIKDQNGLALFATPVSGSLKAHLVNKPLSVPMVLDHLNEVTMTLQVLVVNATDTPQSFGYSEEVLAAGPATLIPRWINKSLSGPLLK
ncbi:hypothetical protein KRR40_06845 [Niabella defluvii]|nr:hypothetical protein KRR40_06845 [Niabella sp. I65]